jgi:hypothetical protein
VLRARVGRRNRCTPQRQIADQGNMKLMAQRPTTRLERSGSFLARCSGAQCRIVLSGLAGLANAATCPSAKTSPAVLTSPLATRRKPRRGRAERTLVRSGCALMSLETIAGSRRSNALEGPRRGSAVLPPETPPALQSWQSSRWFEPSACRGNVPPAPAQARKSDPPLVERPVSPRHVDNLTARTRKRASRPRIAASRSRSRASSGSTAPKPGR